MPAGVVTRVWAHPRTVPDFACQWRREVLAARALGRRVGPERYLELAYEALVRDPGRELARVCAFAGLTYEPAMLGYADDVDVSTKPHQQNLKRPPTAGLRDWRAAMSDHDERAFEAVAGDLLAELGYETRTAPDGFGGRLRRARYAALAIGWKGAAYALQRSPLWRARHPPLA